MGKTSFIKKVTALSLCTALLLPVGTMAAENPVTEVAAGETTAAAMMEETVVETTAEGTGGTMLGDGTAETEAVKESEEAEPGDGVAGTEAVKESEEAEPGDGAAGTEAVKESEEAVPGNGAAGTEAVKESEEAVSEEETAGTEAVPGDESAGGTKKKKASNGRTRKEKNKVTGYILKRFTLYDKGRMAMDVDSLRAELDFARTDDTSGFRLLVDSENTEAGYISVSHIDDMILIVLHGGLSGQTAKYKIDSETLTAILDSDDFNLFLRGTADGEDGSSGDQETEKLTESQVPKTTGTGAEPETETKPDGQETETSGTEEAAPGAEMSEESETGISEESETGISEESEAGMSEAPEAGTETESGEIISEEPEAGTEAAPGTGMSEEPETGTEAESGEIISEEPKAGETEAGQLMINGLSLTSFVRLVNEAYLLINEGAVRNEEVESDQGTFHRSGIVLNREHMRRMLEICSELGIDGGVKESLEAQNIQPEGGALLWGSDKKDYKEVAGSFGVSVEGGAPVWNAFGVYLVGSELTIYNYGMPEQQQSVEIESGTEIVFDKIDPEDGVSWLPADDADAVDLAEMEPAEAIEEISTDIQMVLYDMMGSVLSVVLEEVPEEMVSDMLGLESGEEAVSESESETETDGMMSEDAEDGSEKETGETVSGDGTEQSEEEPETAVN